MSSAISSLDRTEGVAAGACLSFAFCCLTLSVSFYS